MTFFILSTGSVALAAAVIKVGAKAHQSTILSRVDLGSKILTGREIPTIPLPSAILFANLLTTSVIIPLCFFKISSSMSLSSPLSVMERPFKTASFSRGLVNVIVLIERQTGGGSLGFSFYHLSSRNEKGPTLMVSDRTKGCLLSRGLVQTYPLLFWLSSLFSSVGFLESMIDMRVY